MAAGADETAEDLEGQVARLRNENSVLRDLLASAGLDMPTVKASEQGGAVGAADALVTLMAEGGSLLREREELILEHARLTVAQQAAEENLPDLDCLLEALLEVDALNAEREQLRAERGLPSTEEVDEFADALTKLRPLLGETDGLRAERERLVAERRGLLVAVEGAGLETDGLPLCEEDRDLELQLLGAVKGVAHENASLKAEIQELRAQITRLRNASRSNDQPAQALPSLAEADKVPKAPIPRPLPQLMLRSAPPAPPAAPVEDGEPQALPESTPAPLPSEPPATEPKAPVSAEVEKLQEIIQRLQAENTELKSQVVALTPQVDSKPPGDLLAELQREEPPAEPEQVPPAPPADKPVMEAPSSAAEPSAETMPEEPAAEEPPTEEPAVEEPPTEEQTPEAPAVAEEVEAAAPAAEELAVEAPPAPPVEEATLLPAADEAPAVVLVTPAEDLPPKVPPAPAPAAAPELPSQATLKAPGRGSPSPGREGSKSPAIRASRLKAVKPRPTRLSPEELLKQAGVELTPEAMLKQLLSPPSSKKALLQRTELEPEDPEETALQRQEAMAFLLKNQMAGNRNEGFEPECRGRELSPSSRMVEDVDATLEDAMKGALHTLFRSFGS